jgi:hypothetical protein
MEQNCTLISEKSLVRLAMSQSDVDTVEFAQTLQENYQCFGG